MGKANQARLVQLACKQFGVVTAANVARCGVSRNWLRRRLETGEWIRVHRGVFRLGPNNSLEAREMAALLAAGDGAVLSHLSAARRLGLDIPPEDSVQITIPASRRIVKRLSGVRVFRSRDLMPTDITQRGPFRVTHLGRTLVDLPSVLDDAWLRVALDSAMRRRTTDLGWIYRSLRIHGHGRPGAKRLRKLLRAYEGGGEVPDSVLESLGAELARATGHRPIIHENLVADGQRVGEVDIAWPEVRLCVEFDGWRYHGNREAFESDRARDRSLVRLGWRVLRFTYADVTGDRESVISEIVAVYEACARSIRSMSKRARPRTSPAIGDSW